MMRLVSKILLLLLVMRSLAGAAVWGQVAPKTFVKKFEAGYPNQSELNSIWPNGSGWWGLFSKIDSTGPEAYYYGAEVVTLDSTFEIISRRGYGDTSKYYFKYPFFRKKSVPDGNGDFWYWMAGSGHADTTRNLFYGKMDSAGAILFEKEIPNITQYDYFYEFLPLPGVGGVFLSTHKSRFMYVTWLNWVDSLGNIVLLDSTTRINANYRHETLNCTYDPTANIVLAPSNDYILGFQAFGYRPRISVYSLDGVLLKRKDLTSQLEGNSLGNLYRTSDGGYVGKIIEFIPDSNHASEDHRPGIVKLDSSFDVEYKKYLFPPKFFNIANVLYQSKEGDFYLAGSHDAYPTDSLEYLEWFITKFSPSLDSIWTRTYNLGGDSIHGIQQDPIQIQVLENGEVLVLVDNYGFWPPTNTNINYTTLYKLDRNGCLIHACSTEPGRPLPPDSPVPNPKGGIIAYPNPSDGQVGIVWDVNVGDRSTLRVSDMAGRVLLTRGLQRDVQPSTLDLSTWAPGLYVVEMTSELGRVFRTRVNVVR